jgi:hypothetical protein
MTFCLFCSKTDDSLFVWLNQYRNNISYSGGNTDFLSTPQIFLGIIYHSTPMATGTSNSYQPASNFQQRLYLINARLALALPLMPGENDPARREHFIYHITQDVVCPPI